SIFFFFQAEDGIRYRNVTGVQTCALPIYGPVDRDRNHGPTAGDAGPGAGRARVGRLFRAGPRPRPRRRELGDLVEEAVVDGSPRLWSAVAMRIVSLLPSATEALFALGLGDRLVAVTHECDFPPEATLLPNVTRSTLRLEDRQSDAIEAAVSMAAAEGRSLYDVDVGAIRDLEPDLVVAQDVCHVCAVPADQVVPDLPGIRVIRQHPHTLEDVLIDIQDLAAACGTDATSLMASLRSRIQAAARAGRRLPSVRGVFLEWLDPP